MGVWRPAPRPAQHCAAVTAVGSATPPRPAPPPPPRCYLLCAALAAWLALPGPGQKQELPGPSLVNVSPLGYLLSFSTLAALIKNRITTFKLYVFKVNCSQLEKIFQFCQLCNLLHCLMLELLYLKLKYLNFSCFRRGPEQRQV